MKNVYRTTWLVSLVSGLLALTGCLRGDPAASVPSPSAAIDGSKYLLGSEPDGARGVINVREEARDQDDVVIVGRIGGSATPWVDGRAAFSIVDPSLKSCADCGADDCQKPWDYC